jgi:hypothetical protein
VQRTFVGFREMQSLQCNHGSAAQGGNEGEGRLWRDRGKRSEARELLASIYGWFTEGLD